MIALKPLQEIAVPVPKPDEVYDISLFDRAFQFKGLKVLLGAADVSKSGDRLCGLAARDEVEREAARAILSKLTLQHLYDRPLTSEQGHADSVMRVNYDIDHAAFKDIAGMSVGELKDHLLRCKPHEAKRIGRGLTGVMAAAVTKLMDVHELVHAAKKLKRHATARTAVGLPGTLSSRLQPNHPTDDLSAITALLYTGLSTGSGDALIGVNPAIDTVDNISGIPGPPLGPSYRITTTSPG